ncbi:hypothetical protein A3Q56_02181 [Intoshia linei]|uniref:Sm domain-containing protein n=1 Tax=Intoshia linei TaxID=1819745 RepID=A0A177B8T5_9BILA|nr:hypothetical protein A3Q56_02181 [Intoshia linei]
MNKTDKINFLKNLLGKQVSVKTNVPLENGKLLSREFAGIISCMDCFSNMVLRNAIEIYTDEIAEKIGINVSYMGMVTIKGEYIVFVKPSQ